MDSQRSRSATCELQQMLEKCISRILPSFKNSVGDYFLSFFLSYLSFFRDFENKFLSRMKTIKVSIEKERHYLAVPQRN